MDGRQRKINRKTQQELWDKLHSICVKDIGPRGWNFCLYIIDPEDIHVIRN